MSFLRRISIIGIMLFFCALGKRCVAGFTQPTLRCLRATSVRCYSKNLWSVEECREHRDTIKFVDGSCYHKGDRNGRAEFIAGPRIPGAQYLDMNDISTSNELFPDLNPKGLISMFPPKSLFAATMSAMGIEKDDQVIVYGREGCVFTPRTWYLFKTYGQEKVGLMQGSLEEWIQSGGPVDEEPIDYDIWAKELVTQTSNYPVARNAKDRFVDMDQVLERMESTTIVDTRGSSFAKGHIPGAVHIPYSSLVEADNPLKLKPTAELKEMLKQKQITPDAPILLSCGSAVSVCHMALVLDECGYPAPFVYDGSWNEWGSDPTTPKATTEDENNN